MPIYWKQVVSLTGARFDLCRNLILNHQKRFFNDWRNIFFLHHSICENIFSVWNSISSIYMQVPCNLSGKWSPPGESKRKQMYKQMLKWHEGRKKLFLPEDNKVYLKKGRLLSAYIGSGRWFSIKLNLVTVLWKQWRVLYFSHKGNNIAWLYCYFVAIKCDCCAICNRVYSDIQQFTCCTECIHHI